MTGCSDLLYYYSFLWRSVTVLIKDDGASAGYTHPRVGACEAPPTVESSPHQQAIPQEWGHVSLFSARLAGGSPSSTHGV